MLPQLSWGCIVRRATRGSKRSTNREVAKSFSIGMASWGVTLAPMNVVSLERGYDGGDTALRRTWSKLEFVNGIPSGKWIALQYQTSLFEPLTRPIIRFSSATSACDVLMPAPMFGRQMWVGRVPDQAVTAFVSSAETGPCTLQVECCLIVSGLKLIQYALSRSWRDTLKSGWLSLIGMKTHARRQLRLALSATPLHRYHDWRIGNSRTLDEGAVDFRRMDWKNGPHIRFVLSAEEDTVAVGATVKSIRGQAYPNWSIAFVGRTGTDKRRTDVFEFPEALFFKAHDSVDQLCNWESDELVVVPILPGDLVPQYATAILAEYAAANPRVETWYADNDALDSSGRFDSPKLKPDWSPIFNEFTSYSEGATYFRAKTIRSSNLQCASDVLDPAKLDSTLIATHSDRIGHIRRILLTKAATVSTAKVLSGGKGRVEHSITSHESLTSIIIPSKDHATMLLACLRSIDLNDSVRFEILIVDNGSSEGETHALYEMRRHDARTQIISAPGSFNFSKLCNMGAANARGSILLFLNNDIRTAQKNWLEPLVGWASRPDVGAVGAKLLFPAGGLQHGGVVLGLGGYAAHIDVGIPSHSPGYMDRFQFPREVAAVTGACLAVEKKKFEQVGGFDAATFPVEFSDIDLCLRLERAGWRTVFTPETTLIHQESATRRRLPRLDSRYAEEKEQFRQRWGYLLGDDPAFHPALSLQSSETALE